MGWTSSFLRKKEKMLAKYLFRGISSVNEMFYNSALKMYHVTFSFSPGSDKSW